MEVLSRTSKASQDVSYEFIVRIIH
uniref:Uncharacterized protein n=1 Tax=Rhizophora mucronata TaxID=61149 RepID=A0A2P2QFV2_RHIMU